MNIMIILLAILIVMSIIENILLRRNRMAFERLIVKWSDICQSNYQKNAGHDKRLSDATGDITKALQSSLSIKNDSKVLGGSIKELQTISKIIRTSATKEIKEVEDGIKKLKQQLKQEK